MELQLNMGQDVGIADAQRRLPIGYKRMPVKNGSPSTVFNTKWYSNSARFEKWTDLISQLFSSANYEPVANQQDFHAKLKHSSLGAVDIFEIKASPIHSIRTVDSIRKRPKQDFFVGCLVSGASRLTQEDRQSIQAAGDVFVLDSARPFTLEFTGDYHLLYARISRDHLATRLPNAELYVSITLPTASPYAKLVQNTLSETANLNALSKAQAPAQVGAAIIEVIIAALSGGLTDQISCNRRETLLVRAKKLIMDRLSDTEIEIESIATELGVSSRTLSRAFALEGLTPMRWLWQQRVNRAHTLIENGLATQISDAVMQSGFNDFSHFSRVFKKTYGTQPSTFLRECQAALKPVERVYQ